jgi:hypothetical protein
MKFWGFFRIPPLKEPSWRLDDENLNSTTKTIIKLFNEKFWSCAVIFSSIYQVTCFINKQSSSRFCLNLILHNFHAILFFRNEKMFAPRFIRKFTYKTFTYKTYKIDFSKFLMTLFLKNDKLLLIALSFQI